jgi:predicted TIM-barrel fold metal-dependent hydrolase
MAAAAVLAACAPSAPSAPAAYDGPIIDMHLHAFQLEFAAGAPACAGDQGVLLSPIDPAQEFTPGVLIEGCREPMFAPDTDEALVSASLAQLERLNIRRAVTSGAPADVARWRTAGGARIIPAVGFGTSDNIGVDALRQMHARDEVAIFAEVSTQYRGVSADDARYEPFFALAEELDIPVGIHLGEGPPAAGRFPGYETYRAGLTSAFQLESVLRRHPRLRIYVMHYGSPLVDDMMAMMYAYPNLYVDVAFNNWGLPRQQFYDHLERMIDAGFEQRIMFGSDQMIWPDAIAAAADSINAAPFLSAHQKQLIFYDNAARFLRLTREEIAADHAP